MPNNTKKEECKHLNIESNMCPETCKDCGVIIDKNKEEAEYEKESCTHYPRCDKPCTPQSPLSEEKCICGRKKHEWTCKPYVDSVVSPSSNEDWEIEFDKFAESQVISFGTRQETKYLTDIWATAYKELKDFIRTTRLEAQRELTEEIINYMEDGLDEPTDWYVSVKNFLSSRGLLPKITE